VPADCRADRSWSTCPCSSLPRRTAASWGLWSVARLPKPLYADALGHSAQALRLYQAIGDKKSEAVALNNVGWHHGWPALSVSAKPFWTPGKRGLE
jgi:hypothetical protein